MTLAEVVVPTDPDGRGGRGGRRSGVRLAARRSLGAAHARRRALQPNRGPTRHNTGLARHNTRGVGASDSSFVLQEVVIGRYFWGRSNTVEYKAAVAGLTSDRNPPDNTAPRTPTRRTTQKTRRDGPQKGPDAADHTKDPTRRDKHCQAGTTLTSLGGRTITFLTARPASARSTPGAASASDRSSSAETSGDTSSRSLTFPAT